MMGYKVLIVEDDPMVAMINGQYVAKNPDFSVEGTCGNGKDALEFLEGHKVDLVVLDVFMPYKDGVETLREIREKNIPVEVIMVTAANDTTTLERTMNMGVLDYLIKPFDLDRFQIALEKFSAKVSALSSSKTGILDQSCIDSIISGGIKATLPASVSESQIRKHDLPKGIQQKTLETIEEYFKNNPGWQSGDIIAGKLGLSVVTVRHYLSYLTQIRTLTESMNYGTGGRPSMLYRLSVIQNA